MTRRLALLVVLAAAVAACSTSREETWVGRNTGVTVDSGRDGTPPAPPPAGR